MSLLIPTLDGARVNGKHLAELETARFLERNLPATYTVFHGVNWTLNDAWSTKLGEVDFLVMHPSGRLLLIEQKNGVLIETPDGLVKRYGTTEKNVSSQVRRNLENLLSLFQTRRKQNIDLDMLFYCPDFLVVDRNRAGIAANRILDQGEAKQLCDRIVSIFSERPLAKGCCGDTLLVENFLAEELKIKFDVSHLGQLAKTAYVQAASGLSAWVGKLEGAPLKLKIQATAGSGKTQLALDEIRAAKELEKRFLYVCFNRNLADDMKRACGDADSCVTFNELARRLSDELGITSDFNDPKVFERQVDALLSSIHVLSQQFEVLLIDEAQDFEPAWLDALVQLVTPTGRLLVLMDSDQNLYQRESFHFNGFVTLHHSVSYRCPGEIVALINHNELSEEPIQSLSPMEGFDARLETYKHNLELLVATERAVQSLLDAGHTLDNIVVLSVKGEKSSVLMQQSSIGRFSVKKATGRDSRGAYTYSAGELYVDTVFKFKGRSANCVVLAEIDFSERADKASSRLFVGMTRARLELALVVGTDSVYFLEE